MSCTALPYRMYLAWHRYNRRFSLLASLLAALSTGCGEPNEAYTTSGAEEGSTADATETSADVGGRH